MKDIVGANNTDKRILNKNNKILVSGIVKESCVDGVGIRYTIFSQGCPHKCKGCHNPKTHKFSSSLGTWVDIDDIVKDMKENPLLDGITFSGGEPLLQANSFSKLAKKIKENNYNIWMWTGYTWEFIISNLDNHKHWKELLKYVDYLVDGPFILQLKEVDLLFRGSTNQRIIDVQRSIKENKIIEFEEEVLSF